MKNISKRVVITLLFLVFLSYNIKAYSIILSNKQSFPGAPYCFAYWGGEINKLYMTRNATSDNLWVYDIDPATGLPVGGYVSYTINGSATNNSLAIDPARRKLYVGTSGATTNEISACDLSETGMPILPFAAVTTKVGASLDSIMIDPSRNRLYATSTGTNWLGVAVLADTGGLTGETKTYTAWGGNFYGMVADIKRNTLYSGGICTFGLDPLTGNIISGQYVMGVGATGPSPDEPSREGNRKVVRDSV